MATGGQQVHANMLQIARERQIRTTTRYHLTPVKMAIIKNITNNSENVERREPLYNVAGTVNWYRHCGKQYRGFSKYLKINLPYDPAIPLLRNYLKNMKTLTCQDKATDRPVKHRSHCQCSRFCGSGVWVCVVAQLCPTWVWGRAWEYLTSQQMVLMLLVLGTCFKNHWSIPETNPTL